MGCLFSLLFFIKTRFTCIFYHDDDEAYWKIIQWTGGRDNKVQEDQKDKKISSHRARQTRRSSFMKCYTESEHVKTNQYAKS